MYLKVEDSNISFKVDGKKVVARKIIHRRVYKIEKDLSTNNIDYLWKVLSNLEKLPEELWKLE